MLAKYFQLEKIKNSWEDKKNQTSKLVLNARALFGNFKADTIWDWLENLGERMNVIEIQKAGKDIDTAFELAIINEFDWEKLNSLGMKLEKLRQIFAEITNASNAPGVTGKVKPEWVAKLDLGEEENNFYNRFLQLSPAVQQEAVEIIQELVKEKEEMQSLLTLLAAAMLFYSPPDTPATLTNFIPLMEDYNPDLAESNSEQWPLIVRYLSQAFYSKDTDAINWAIDNFAESQVSLACFSEPLQHLLLVLMIYLFFANFKNLDIDLQYSVINNQSWPAMALGVPVEELFKERLAEEVTEIDYVKTSGFYADLLLDSRQILFFFEEAALIDSGDFIGDFLMSTHDDDWNQAKQQDFIDQTMSFYHIKDESKRLTELLLRWLNLYLHLRECNLIDYHGLLSEAGLLPDFDWPVVLSNEIDDLKLLEIEQYLKLVKRPLLVKIKIISALQNLKWQEEPYLSRILAISDVYESVYGERFGHLIYFDESQGEFVLNQDLPDLVKDFCNFIAGKHGPHGVIHVEPPK